MSRAFETTGERQPESVPIEVTCGMVDDHHERGDTASRFDSRQSFVSAILRQWVLEGAGIGARSKNPIPGSAVRRGTG
jgi:hypothetical protein